ncbi:GNAT family N-acetyltransferase [Pseudoruegeria sp. SK021]|uniref:GNAT family N-acetyltransferase n=1 Tax=Pseudoruegeria sp. SK021 TaxID=1933035 RepID=UPI000A22B9CA|nr:GNAT family N-acetyltransferase [Pseudoruegeria sp. SK021]OSP55696.1 hypothetical protein BV911_06200 [Pseudoruegeria sp. SK021]
MSRPEYTFLPVTRADIPRLRHWLSGAHIGGWWGDPETEIALIGADMDSGQADMRIVWHEGTPFAFVQDYPAHHWPAPHYADLPKAARALDTFLGDPDFLGQGHASGYLRSRAQALLDRGAPCVCVDPDPTNLRAIAAYEKAGFDGSEIRDCDDGDKVRVMIFKG